MSERLILKRKLAAVAREAKADRFCCGCDRTRSRMFFSGKEWDLDERWCVSCVAEDLANRLGLGLLG